MDKRWQDWVQLALGAWLFVSPWVLGYTKIAGAAANAYLIGAALVVFAIIALYAPKVWEEWISLVLGLWLIISPWFMGFSPVEEPEIAVVVFIEYGGSSSRVSVPVARDFLKGYWDMRGVEVASSQ